MPRRSLLYFGGGAKGGAQCSSACATGSWRRALQRAWKACSIERKMSKRGGWSLQRPREWRRRPLGFSSTMAAAPPALCSRGCRRQYSRAQNTRHTNTFFNRWRHAEARGRGSQKRKDLVQLAFCSYSIESAREPTMPPCSLPRLSLSDPSKH